MTPQLAFFLGILIGVGGVIGISISAVTILMILKDRR